METVQQLLILGALSAIASFIAGLLGAGGGIVLLPLLIYVPPLLGGTSFDTHTASALAAVQAVFAAVGGGLQLKAWTGISPRRLAIFGPGLALTSFAGGALSALMSANLLLVAFAAMTSLATLVLLLPKDEEAGPPGAWADVTAAALMAAAGLIGGAVGAGYGPLLVAILLHVVRLPTRLANGTALILGIFTALPAVLGKMATNQVPVSASFAVALTTLLFVVIGWKSSRVVPPHLLRWLLAAVTGTLAARVWITLLANLAVHSR